MAFYVVHFLQHYPNNPAFWFEPSANFSNQQLLFSSAYYWALSQLIDLQSHIYTLAFGRQLNPISVNIARQVCIRIQKNPSMII
jgi:hypothetical protein